MYEYTIRFGGKAQKHWSIIQLLIELKRCLNMPLGLNSILKWLKCNMLRLVNERPLQDLEHFSHCQSNTGFKLDLLGVGPVGFSTYICNDKTNKGCIFFAKSSTHSFSLLLNFIEPEWRMGRFVWGYLMTKPSLRL